MTDAALTESQAARRQRVVMAAMALGAEGGYEAVQMRDVAARADVALGTIYRYFSSKDHLLAAALVEWVLELESRVAARPPTGATVADRVVALVRRAARAMERQPQLSSAVITALVSPDAKAAHCQESVSAVMNRIMLRAIDPDVVPDADRREAIVHTLGMVWFSSLIGWVNGWQRIGQVGDELEAAAHLLLDHY